MAGPNLPIHMGINSQAVRNIPQEWDPRWFRRFITDHLQWADFRNAIAGPGITITGTEQQRGEISSTGGGGGSITDITSTGGSVTITGGTGPTVDIEVQVTPDTHPVTENPINDEFEYGTTLDTTGSRFAGASPWTLLNSNGTTLTVQEGSLVATGGTISSIEVALQPLSSSTSFAVGAKVSSNAPSLGAGSGLYLYNAGSGFGLFFAALNGGGSGGGDLSVQRWSGGSSPIGGATVFTGGALPETSAGTETQIPWTYLQIAYSTVTGNVTFSFSASGVPLSYGGGVYTEALSAYLGAVTHIGLIFAPLSSGASVFDWFRRFS